MGQGASKASGGREGSEPEWWKKWKSGGPPQPLEGGRSVVEYDSVMKQSQEILKREKEREVSRVKGATDGGEGRVEEDMVGWDDTRDGPGRLAAYAARMRNLVAIKGIRYVGYSSDVGEAFRPLVPRWFVNATYGLGKYV